MKISCFLTMTAALIGLQSCSSKEEGFEISFELSNAKDAKILVNQDVPEMKSWYIDTIPLVDGKAIYRGKVAFPQKLEFSFHGPAGEFYGACGVFTDNSRIQVKGDFRQLKACTSTGGKADTEFREIEEKGSQLFRRFNVLSYERGQAFKKDRHKYDSLSRLADLAQQKVFDYILAIPGYSKSPVAAYFVFKNFGTSNMKELQKAVNAFDSSMGSNPYVAQCRKDMENELKVMPGNMAPDFTLQDLEGKEYSLSALKGKYILLEFSASWCGWCKLEVPYLKQLYEKTKGKNFVMLTVNLDEKRSKWEEDVKAHQLPWPVISDLKGFNGGMSALYNIGGIPMTYLISPEGKILKKGLRREPMIQYITTLLENK